MTQRGSRPALRAHVGLEVTDLARSIDFYRSLLGLAPSKVRPGYARFEPVDPGLNLTLNENPRRGARPAGAHHYGIEVPTAVDVAAWQERLLEEGLAPRAELGTVCCYARQDKVWVTDPDGHAWEVFTVLEDADRRSSDAACCAEAEACCTP